VPFSYEYPRPALTVDCVVFGLDEDGLQILLIRRARGPFRGRWALPGGFVHANEPLEAAARRELREETGVTTVYLEQLYSFGDPGRDPRGHTVSVAYYALVRRAEHAAVGGDDAAEAAWHPVSSLPSLAFDHKKIVAKAIERIQNKVRYEPIGFELLAPRFTLSHLQHVYETIVRRDVDKRNFRKKILGMGILVETDEVEAGVRHRAARLYRFDKRGYQELRKSGWSFDL
jgi:8-oxo-dGTP diphosphatase